MKKLLIYVAMLFVFVIWAVATIRIYQIKHNGRMPGVVSGLGSFVPGLDSAPKVKPYVAPVSRAPAVALSTASLSSTPLISTTTTAIPQRGVRKIGFKYHDVRARQVLIKLEFEGWKSQQMVKGENGIWTYTAAGNFPPGEYAYYYEVDGRKIPKDPANKRTKKVGPVTLSSVIVKPAE